MKIGIDAHVLGTQAGGNETYMRGLLHALYTHAPESDILAFVHRNTPATTCEFPTAAIPLRKSFLRVPFALPWLARRSGIDLLHVQYTAPPYCPCPYVVSMHDAVALRFPESMPFLDRHRLRLLSRSTLHRAARIFVLTQAIRDEIADIYNLPTDRFDIVQPHTDPAFQPVTDDTALAAVRKKYALPEQYILYVGLLQPRKNLDRLAQAFARLRDRGLDHKLVIVGKRAWLYKEMLAHIDTLGLENRIVFTGYIDRADLPTLYSAAQAFAYISLYEGFGIPVLEAMSCGTPVLASTDPALREVTKGAALHVDPYDIDAVEEALAGILTDTPLRERLRKEGPQQAATFTSERMARAALDGYEKALQ